jgi:hypothetical protein
MAGGVTAPFFSGSVYGPTYGTCHGNADTVTNGVYTNGSYYAPSWLKSVAASAVNLSTVPVGGSCSGVTVMTGHDAGAVPTCSQLAGSGVTPGTYGSASAVPVCAFSSSGTAVSCSNTNIAIAESAVADLTSHLSMKASTGTNSDITKTTALATIDGVAVTVVSSLTVVSAAGIKTSTITASTGTFTDYVSAPQVTATNATLGTLNASATGYYNGGQYASAKKTDTVASHAFFSDLSLGNVHYVELENYATISMTLGSPIDGGRYLLILKQPSSGSGVITSWDSSILWPAGSPPTLTATVNKVDIVALVYDGTNSKFYASTSLNY